MCGCLQLVAPISLHARVCCAPLMGNTWWSGSPGLCYISHIRCGGGHAPNFVVFTVDDTARLFTNLRKANIVASQAGIRVKWTLTNLPRAEKEEVRGNQQPMRGATCGGGRMAVTSRL